MRSFFRVINAPVAKNGNTRRILAQCSVEKLQTGQLIAGLPDWASLTTPCQDLHIHRVTLIIQIIFIKFPKMTTCQTV